MKRLLALSVCALLAFACAQSVPLDPEKRVARTPSLKSSSGQSPSKILMIRNKDLEQKNAKFLTMARQLKAENAQLKVKVQQLEAELQKAESAADKYQSEYLRRTPISISP